MLGSVARVRCGVGARVSATARARVWVRARVRLGKFKMFVIHLLYIIIKLLVAEGYMHMVIRIIVRR